MRQGTPLTSPNPECPTHHYNCRLNNLSVASRVYILEPQWNPSVEDQAIGRVLRLGQDKQVCIIRYVTSGTIEEASWTSYTCLFGQLSNSVSTECKVSPTDEDTTGSRWPSRAQQNRQVYGFHRSAYGSSTSWNHWLVKYMLGRSKILFYVCIDAWRCLMHLIARIYTTEINWYCCPAQTQQYYFSQTQDFLKPIIGVSLPWSPCGIQQYSKPRSFGRRILSHAAQIFDLQPYQTG